MVSHLQAQPHLGNEQLLVVLIRRVKRVCERHTVLAQAACAFNHLIQLPGLAPTQVVQRVSYTRPKKTLRGMAHLS